MILTRSNLRSLNWPALLTFVLPVGFLVWAFGNTLGEMVHAWWASPQSSHGFLVPVFSLFLLWHRRNLLDDATLRPSWWGLPLLAAGIGLHLYGAYYYYIWIDAVAFLPMLAGVWLTCGGKAGWRWGWPSILFLFFMIPLPYRVAIALSGPLQRLATIISTFIMQCIGMPALAEGNVVRLNEHDIDIVQACSGLRMLVVFFALSTAVVFVDKRHWLDKVLLILSAVPIALVSNITRIIVTGILIDFFKAGDTVVEWIHDTGDLLMMPFALGLLWVELKLLNQLFVQLPGTHRPAPRTVTAKRTPQTQPQLVRKPAGKRQSVQRPAVVRQKQTPAPVPQPQSESAEVAAEQPVVESGEVQR